MQIAESEYMETWEGMRQKVAIVLRDKRKPASTTGNCTRGLEQFRSHSKKL